MKNLLLALVAVMFFSCAKDSVDSGQGSTSERVTFINTPDGAIAGALLIEVTPEVADRIEANTAQITRSGGVATRAGISDMDLVFDKIGIENFRRTFPYEEEYEAAHRAFGLHLWYTLRFDTTEELATAGKLLSEVAGISTIEYRHKIKPMREGRMIPYNKANIQQHQTRAGMPMNDPKLAEQWHYHNTGNISATLGDITFKSKSGADINLYEAWELSTGSPEIIVAVLDDPVQTTHPDLKGNMWVNPKPGSAEYGQDLHGYNFYNKTDKLDWTSSYYDTEYDEYIYADHGTHVAGTIAAINGNGQGVCGIAGGQNGSGGVKIMSCQIMGYNTVNAQADAAARAFVYAADRGALIAQCSWGYSSDMKTQQDWIQNDGGAEKKAVDYFISNAGKTNPNSPLSGGLVIFAAGNDGHIVRDQMEWPAAYAPTIAVSSIAPDYTPGYYSSYGKWVDITAPGGDYHYGDEGQVLSTILDDPAINFKDDRTEGYGYMQGTSMACPHVSGVAALALSHAAKLGKHYTLEQFKTLLMSSANDINPYMVGTRKYYTPEAELRTLTLSNYAQKMGSGYIDAYKILLNVQGTPSIYIKQGTSKTIDLKSYFGAAASFSTFTVSISTDIQSKLGMTQVPVASNGSMTVSCSKCGAGIITVSTTLGETKMSQEIALIVRESVADNGGWL